MIFNLIVKFAEESEVAVALQLPIYNFKLNQKPINLVVCFCLNKMVYGFQWRI